MPHNYPRPMRWPITGFRTVTTWLVGALATVVAVPLVMLFAMVNDTSRWIDRVIQAWSATWLLAARCTLEVEGREHIDPTRSYVVVSNHLSTLDIMACFRATGIPIRYLAKKELYRVPILAQGMRAVGIIEVDRAARGAIHATVNKQAKELIAKNRSLIIYAEGTRPRDGVMKRFKKGAFTMAVAGQLPILPVSIHGTFEAMPPGTPWVRGGPAKVVIGQAIETEGLTQADAGDLRDQVREIIAGRVSEMGGPVG